MSAAAAIGWLWRGRSIFALSKRAAANGCLRWLGPLTSEGYPQMKVAGRLYPAHRFAAAIWFGAEAIRGKDVHHTCERRDCVNAEHMVPLTPSEHRSVHAGGVAPRPPPKFTGGLDAEAVLEVMRKGGSSWRRTAAQEASRKLTFELVLIGLLANHGRRA